MYPMKMKSILVICFALISTLFFAQSKQSGKQNVNNHAYPYGNPIIRHMYTADAAPHVMPDGKVWIVTSVDSDLGGGYGTMHCYHSFSSPDMVHWTDHGEIFNLNDALQGKPEPQGQDWALWAPDMVYRNGKYYLYYPVRIANDALETAKGNNGESYIAVAVSDNPGHHFKVINPRIEKTGGIDPAIFVDDDGLPYLYWGSHNAAKLKENMYELAEEPKKLDVNTDRFMEAIWMDKHDGKFYLSYHTIYNWKVKITDENANDSNRLKSELAYSVGDSPMGPFKYMGTFNFELGVNVNNGPRIDETKKYVPWRYMQSNHGGIVEFHGQEYLFYHTSALSSWRQDEFKGPGTWTQRSVCVDKLNYNADGTIIPVQQTIESVPAVVINQPFEINLLKKPTVVNENKRILSFEKVNLGTGYYYFGLTALNVSKPCRAEIRLDSPTGKLVGTALVNNNGVSECSLRGANGIHMVYLVFNESIKISQIHFFAGKPMKKN